MDKSKENMDNFIRIMSGEGKNKFYVLLFVPEKKIYLDINATPYGDAMFLCAGHDGTEVFIQESNDKDKKKITFLPLEWIINDWGGSKDVIESCKKLREHIERDWDKLIEEHKVFMSKIEEDNEGKRA